MLIIGGSKVFYEQNMYKSFINVYGLNRQSISYICNHLGIPSNLEFEHFDFFGNFQHKTDLYKFFLVSESNLESLLKRKQLKNIEALIKMNCYRGLRHKLGFPVRGQRTHTNAKTIRYLKHKKKVVRRYKKKSNNK